MERTGQTHPMPNNNEQRIQAWNRIQKLFLTGFVAVGAIMLHKWMNQTPNASVIEIPPTASLTPLKTLARR